MVICSQSTGVKAGVVPWLQLFETNQEEIKEEQIPSSSMNPVYACAGVPSFGDQSPHSLDQRENPHPVHRSQSPHCSATDLTLTCLSTL
ncbi:hypothetical protein ILYODFUR_020443 [Ilyodon furcidens]|uniref:Uncharacterized protein n=1 Tax=Ilyodon furcidens TaxID=33524 RepID=A0ABV0T2G6_9TELE